MESYTLTQVDDDGMETLLELNVEIERYHPGGFTHSRSITDNPGELELGDIFLATSGERYEPTMKELETIEADLHETLLSRDREGGW